MNPDKSISLSFNIIFNILSPFLIHRFCGLVVRVPDYRSRGPGSIRGRYQIFC
jgi:hypothetical protein